MALSSALPVKVKLQTVSVQELVKTTGKQVPETYINNLPNKRADDPSELKYMDNCIIDLSLLFSSSLDQQEQELRKLQSVLSSWGWLQLINHGLSASLLKEIRQLVKEFFDLPLEEKLKCRTPDWLEGYGGDTIPETQFYNWSDRIRLKIYPFDHRNLKIWPESLPNFRATIEEYAKETIRLLEMMMKAIAKSLNLNENSFFNACGGHEGINMHMRFNYYPPCSSPDKVLGIKPHSDATTITFNMLDNEVEGLQIQKDNQWYKVPIVPDSIFINIGDQMEIISNGIYKSVVHKVVIDKERERTSVVMLHFPDPNQEIGPLGELIDKERPQLYKKTQNYFDAFRQCYLRGERGIHQMKV